MRSLSPSSIPVGQRTRGLLPAFAAVMALLQSAPAGATGGLSCKADDQNLELAVQTISNLHSSPSGVPGGEAGMAAEDDGFPMWALGLGLASAVGLTVAGRQVVPARRRR